MTEITTLQHCKDRDRDTDAEQHRTPEEVLLSGEHAVVTDSEVMRLLKWTSETRVV